MSNKATKINVLIVTGCIAVVSVAVVFMAINNRPTGIIPAASSLEKARQLSKGQKDACLTDNPQATAAVKEDDTWLDEEKTFSRFELSASEGIIDVPAGTDYDLTINSYDGKTVRGAIAYDKDYGTYNYTIQKSPAPGEWKFESMAACTK